VEISIFAAIDLQLLRHADRSRVGLMHFKRAVGYGRPILAPVEVSAVRLRRSVGLMLHVARQQRFTHSLNHSKNLSGEQRKSNIMIVGNRNKNIYKEG